MNFVIDQNLPAWLAGWLRDAGHDAVHLRDIGLQRAPDAEVAALSRARRAALVTKDSDFARPPGPGAQVVWVGVGNVTHDRIAAILKQAWPEIERALLDGESLIELRSSPETPPR